MSSLDNYGGTGRSFAQLEAMPRHLREALLAETIYQLRDSISVLKGYLDEAEAALREAMLARNASLLDTGEHEVKIKPKRRYEYDHEGLSQLQAFVPAERYERAVAVVETVKVNKLELNKLAKMGADIAAIIDQSTYEQITGFDLEISKKKAVVQP